MSMVMVMVKSLVADPASVNVSLVPPTEGRAGMIRVEVAHADAGKVIGKDGRIARSLRNVVFAAAMQQDRARYSLDIVAPVPRPGS